MDAVPLRFGRRSSPAVYSVNYFVQGRLSRQLTTRSRRCRWLPGDMTASDPPQLQGCAHISQQKVICAHAKHISGCVVLYMVIDSAGVKKIGFCPCVFKGGKLTKKNVVDCLAGRIEPR